MIIVGIFFVYMLAIAYTLIVIFWPIVLIIFIICCIASICGRLAVQTKKNSS
jgi:hypothetical protein